MAATYVGCYKGTLTLLEGGNFNSDAYKLALSNSQPTVATDTTIVAELANGNGYLTGGAAITTASHALTGGVYKVTFTVASPTWTATGAMGPFRYVILYNSTQSQVVAYWDYGSSVNMVNTDTFTVTIAAECLSITTP